jgi:hypothetical protein
LLAIWLAELAPVIQMPISLKLRMIELLIVAFVLVTLSARTAHSISA